MQDTVEKIFNHAHGIWRFRWYAVITAWVISPIGWYIVSKVPDTYESKAQIYVDTDSILKPLLRGLAVDSMNLDERLGMMTKALLSRPNLEQVIREVDLDVSIQSKIEYEMLVGNLVRNVHIQSTRTHRTPRPEPPNLYEIAARNSNPDTAYKIVNSLLNIFLEKSLSTNRKDSYMAQQFLEKQIKEYEARLVAAEKRLREFNTKNIGRLPEQGQTFFQSLRTTQESLDSIDLEIREEENRKNELGNQLNSVNPNQRIISREGRPVLSPVEQRINTLRERLDELLLKYTDHHPDVLETKSVLVELEREKKMQASQGDSTGSQYTTQNPMYQQIKIALGEVEANIAALQVRRSEFKKRLSKHKQQMEILPQVEAELKALNRDYEINKANYDTLIQRRESAIMAQQVDKTGENTKLKVIDPPRVPVTPITPNRPLLISLVLFAGMAAGVGLAFLMSQIRPTFDNVNMLRAELTAPIFGSVSMLALPDTVYKRKLRLFVFFITNGLLIVICAGVLYFSVR